jgi:DNA sulfur modification protein DndE
MKAPVSTIVTTSQGRDQLMRMKRIMGISQWNIIMRWAVCLSLREDSMPPVYKAKNQDNESSDSERSVTVEWSIFAGKSSEMLIAALKLRFIEDCSDDSTFSESEYFHRHLHRGLNILDGNLERDEGNRTLLKFLIN